MTLLRIFFLIAALALVVAIFWAMDADGRSPGAVLAEMTGEPWSAVTLIDLYLGFFIAATIIFLVEKNKLVAALWAAPIFVLGNLWTAVWFAYRLPDIARRLKT